MMWMALEAEGGGVGRRPQQPFLLALSTDQQAVPGGWRGGVEGNANRILWDHPRNRRGIRHQEKQIGTSRRERPEKSRLGRNGFSAEDSFACREAAGKMPRKVVAARWMARPRRKEPQQEREGSGGRSGSGFRAEV